MASGRQNGLDNLAFDMNVDDQQTEKEEKTRESSNKNKPTYCVTDVPPWYLCIFLAIQHYLTAFGAMVSIPLILSEGLCLQHDSLTQSRLINTIFFASGLITILQVTFGVRLPILQGGTFSLVTPAMAMLSMPEWKCPAWTQNATLVNTSSPLFIEVWQTRIQTLQGSIMVASLLQILVGFSGLIGFLMRFIGPLTIAPTVSLIGLSLYDSAGAKVGSHWGISAMYVTARCICERHFAQLEGCSEGCCCYCVNQPCLCCRFCADRLSQEITVNKYIEIKIKQEGYFLSEYGVITFKYDFCIIMLMTVLLIHRTTVLIILFSQYLRRIPIPVPAYSKAKKLHTSKFYIFQIMPILLGILISWLVCYLLTIYDVLPSDPAQYGHLARTDVKGDVLNEAPWFTFPYPGQWGMPAVSLAGVFGMMAGIICSMAESVGDYLSCARLSGAPPPPKHAINRGIGIEGVGSLLAGALGTGNGTTSFSENVAALGITKVGSRVVILLSGVVMILIGMVGKIGAIFTTIPTPVLGGMFLIMFGVITAAGISNLQSTDMNSSRNIFVFGFSMFSALVIPNWIMKNPDFLDTGVEEVDQVLHILLTTHMFVGGFLGFFLDNTIPGTKRERGLSVRDKDHLEDSSCTLGTEEVYDLPFGITSCLSSQSWVRYIPFCPFQRSENKSEDKNMQQSWRSKQLPNDKKVTDEFAF